MFKYLKKNFTKKKLIIACDILLLPFLFFCRILSEYMLSKYSVCPWVRLGGKCVTCGGTHFVNYILSGRIKDAFFQNEFLFFLLIYFIITFILLNFYCLFDNKFAKKALSKMYSIASLIVFCAALLFFFFARNMPLFIRIAEACF